MIIILFTKIFGLFAMQTLLLYCITKVYENVLFVCAKYDVFRLFVIAFIQIEQSILWMGLLGLCIPFYLISFLGMNVYVFWVIDWFFDNLRTIQSFVIDFRTKNTSYECIPVFTFIVMKYSYFDKTA